ncbi:hypothetical protein ACPCAG_16585 [Streptomyces pseudogriseolus]|uniref:hypothetical protein n=1 Tax=Streptomyces pseudogriseolus TaxID=36817 RepID=UPI003FA211F6
MAEEAGRERVVAPVRPTVKARYPLTPIETSMRWTCEDGSALDPWIRTHQRLGAALVSAAPASQIMTGTVAEWERWTGLAFPETGDYMIPRGPRPPARRPGVGRGRLPGAQRLDAAPLTALTAGAGGRTGSGPGR